MPQHDFSDVRRLSRFREALESIEDSPSPKAVPVAGPDRVRRGRVGILPGSFNPPTVAHLELAAAARRGFRLDRVVFSLSSVTVDKERVQGLCREDRLLLLSLVAEERAWAGAAVVNRGLYYEQAPAFRACFGADLWFIVGMDKVVQIFDPRYYDDRDRALNSLFARARLIAANREDLGGEELRALLERPDNAPYRDRVHPLVLPSRLRVQSSSGVRRAIEEGAPCEDELPPVVRSFIEATAAFRPPYDLRAAALDALHPAPAKPTRRRGPR